MNKTTVVGINIHRSHANTAYNKNPRLSSFNCTNTKPCKEHVG